MTMKELAEIEARTASLKVSSLMTMAPWEMSRVVEQDVPRLVAALRELMEKQG